MQLRLYTRSNSARQPIASSVVHKLQLISSTDCNFRRTQIATLVLGQLHSGWVGQLQLPWTVGCSSICIPVPTQTVSRLHLQSYTNCNSSLQPIATSIVNKLQLIPSTDCNFHRTQIATCSHARCMPASLHGGAVLAWERVEVCGPRLISGSAGPRGGHEVRRPRAYAGKGPKSRYTNP